MRKKAFTLAEVLITLGIIGVVAAMVIPVLIQNSQKAQYVTSLQKTYTTLSQAFAKYAADNGCVGDMACTGLFSDTIANNITKWDDFVTNYLKMSKNCSAMTTPDCFAPSYKLVNYNGTINPNATTTSGRYQIILNDGTSVSFSSQADNCANTPAFGGGLCTQLIMVDVNGYKGPNILGRDLFSNIALTKNKGILGWNGSTAYADATCAGWVGCKWSNPSADYYFYCGTAAPSNGEGCFSRVFEENWQMNY